MEGKKKKYAENRLKNKSINIRTDEAHYNKFNQLANDLKLNKNTLVEKIIDEGFQQIGYISAPSLDEICDNFYKAIAPIGKNINQIATVANTTGKVDYEKFPDITKLLNNIEKLIAILKNKDKYIIEDILLKGTNKNGDV